MQLLRFLVEALGGGALAAQVLFQAQPLRLVAGGDHRPRRRAVGVMQGQGGAGQDAAASRRGGAPSSARSRRARLERAVERRLRQGQGLAAQVAQPVGGRPLRGRHRLALDAVLALRLRVEPADDAVLVAHHDAVAALAEDRAQQVALLLRLLAAPPSRW